MMTTINPYLTFNGNCRDAFNFYKSVFGGEFQYIGTLENMPDSPDYNISESEKDKIMHVSLPISKNSILMGSDSPKAFGNTAVTGTNFSIAVETDSKEEADHIFAGLAADGKVKMALSDTFWGAYFGMLTDKYDIQWQVSCDLNVKSELEPKN